MNRDLFLFFVKSAVFGAAQIFYEHVVALTRNGVNGVHYRVQGQVEFSERFNLANVRRHHSVHTHTTHTRHKLHMTHVRARCHRAAYLILLLVTSMRANDEQLASSAGNVVNLYAGCEQPASSFATLIPHTLTDCL